MKKSSLCIFILSVICLIHISPPVNAQEGILFKEDFEGQLGPRWGLDPGWQVVEEGGNAVLEGKGHTWAVVEQLFPGEFRLTLRLRVLSGRIHLVTHLTGRSRYFIGVGGGPAVLNKQYFPDEFEMDLALSEGQVSNAVWHNIEIISDGDSLRLIVDGQEQWAYQDPLKLGSGSIAFETLEESRVQVDDIVLYGSGEPLSESPEEEAVPEDVPEAGTAAWIRTGGPLGGLGYDVRMDPEDPDRMYVTDAFAGVFISGDGGETWHPSNQGITDRMGESGDAIPVFCLTIDPNNPDIVWAGTQYSGGIFKSTDRGENWVRTSDGIYPQEGLTFRGITIQPGDSQVVYAAGEVSSWSWSGEPLVGREFDLTKGVVYKSENGGSTWRAVWQGDNLARYVLINPQDTDIVYISTGIFDREAANSDPASGEPGGEGVLKSTDGGETWEQVNHGLHNLYVGSLYMHPEDPEVLLAGTGNNQYYENGGVYLTTDGARTWEHVFNAGDTNINSVEFSEMEPDIAYAGGDPQILRSEDGGRTWVKVSQGDHGWGDPGVRGGFPIDFQIDPRDPYRIFANNYGGGNFLSEDGGKTWVVASQGYTGAQVRSIAVDPEHPGRVYAAARSGIFVSRDGGSSWIGLAKPPFRTLEWNAVGIDPSNPEHLLSGNNWTGNILSSQDAGGTWQVVFPEPGENKGLRVFTFAPSDPRWVYAGTGAYYSAGVFSPDMPAKGIYLSQDGGQSWVQSTTESFSDAHVTDISIAREDHQVVYAATTNYGVIRSLDGGQSWEQINEGLRLRTGANTVAIHPEDEEVVFAGIAFGGVYRSGDGGETWQHSSVGLNPEAMIVDLIFDPNDSQILYTSDLFSGVYRSRDGGETWQVFSKDLRTRSVNQLAMSADGAHLYAATEGEGVYRMDLNGQPPVEAPLPDAWEEKPEDEKPTEEDEPVEESELASEGPEQEPTSLPPTEEAVEGLKRQICPGSYLPMFGALLLCAGWQAERKRRS